MTNARPKAGSPIDGTRRSNGDAVQMPSERSFGRVFTVVFALVGGYQLYAGRIEIGSAVLALAVLTALIAWLKPTLLGPVNRLWFRFGQLLHHIVTPVVMFAVFATTVVPIGLIMRALGHDPLQRKRDPNAETYWIQRSPPGPEPGSMRNQF